MRYRVMNLTRNTRLADQAGRVEREWEAVEQALAALDRCPGGSEIFGPERVERLRRRAVRLDRRARSGRRCQLTFHFPDGPPGSTGSDVE